MFYKDSILYCLNILLSLLSDNTISKTGGVFSLLAGIPRCLSYILAGTASTLVDKGKSLFLWGDELDFFCRTKKFATIVMILYNNYFQNHIQLLQFQAVRMCISILTISNTPVEMRSGNVQLDQTYCLYLIQCAGET